MESSVDVLTGADPGDPHCGDDSAGFFRIGAIDLDGDTLPQAQMPQARLGESLRAEGQQTSGIQQHTAGVIIGVEGVNAGLHSSHSRAPTGHGEVPIGVDPRYRGQSMTR